MLHAVQSHQCWCTESFRTTYLCARDSATLHIQAVSNFLALCHGADVAGRRLCFAGVPVTRLVKRYLLQTGDADAHDGSGAVQQWLAATGQGRA